LNVAKRGLKSAVKLKGRPNEFQCSASLQGFKRYSAPFPNLAQQKLH